MEVSIVGKANMSYGPQFSSRFDNAFKYAELVQKQTAEGGFTHSNVNNESCAISSDSMISVVSAAAAASESQIGEMQSSQPLDDVASASAAAGEDEMEVEVQSSQPLDDASPAAGEDEIEVEVQPSQPLDDASPAAGEGEIEVEVTVESI
jgi:hypothetical protein